MVGVDRVRRGAQNRVDVLDHVVGRKTTFADPEVHRPARREETHPQHTGRVDLGGEQVTTIAREDVVVVHRGRAPGLRQLRQPAERGRPHDVLVDAGPDGIQRGQPLEQRVVDSEATGHPLVEVVMGVDEAGRRQASGRVDVRRVGQVRRSSALADCRDPGTLHDDVADGVLRPVRVHRGDRAPVEHDRGHSASPGTEPDAEPDAALAPIRPAASRTASRIFS